MASIATTKPPSPMPPRHDRSSEAHPPSDKSLLSTLNLGFLKNFSDKKETRDGQPSKRRGPKPNSKPALTRRQELNRQAQRTHRERKELYIKALEDEVLRLKEFYSSVTRDRSRLAEENQQLRALLSQNGISLPSPVAGGLTAHHPNPTEMITPLGDSPIRDRSVGPYTGSSGLSATGSYGGGGGGGGGGASSSHTSAFTPPSLPVTGAQLTSSRPGDTGHVPMQVQQPPPHYPHQQQQQQRQHDGHQQVPLSAGVMPIQEQPHVAGRNANIDYDQAGVDFVLTLEKPCMDHLPWLLERSTEAGGRELCGHALMASCPPDPIPFLAGDAPSYTRPGDTGSNRTGPVGGGGGGNNATNAILGNSAVSSHRSVLHRKQKPQQQTIHQGPHQHGGSQGYDDTIMADADAASQQQQQQQQQPWGLTKADLSTLLILSQRLNLDGEITPVMAWGMVLAHPRLADLQMEDFGRLAEELRSKVRCYGFGAVMEEFEVRDALESVLSTKHEVNYEFRNAF